MSRPQLSVLHFREGRPAVAADAPGAEGKLSGSSPRSARSVLSPAQELPDRGGPPLRLAAHGGQGERQSGIECFFHKRVQVSE